MLERLQNRAEVIVAGHRGMKAFYPENTLLSFQKALDQKVDMLEIDLNLTRDKQVVIIHDNTVDRTSDGSGFVHDFTLSEIKKLDAGGWFGVEFAGQRIPTLQEFCEFLQPYSELLLNVEIKEKTTETVDLSMEILRKAGLLERCVFTCFDATIVGYLHDRYGVKTQGFPDFLMQNFVAGEKGTYSKMFAVGIAMKYLTPEIVAEFETRGILPWSYCPDTDEQVLYSIECGVRLVTVNNPEPSLRILRAKGLHR